MIPLHREHRDGARTEIVPARVEVAPTRGQVVVHLLVRVEYPALPERTSDASGVLTVYPATSLRIDDEFDIRHVMELVQLKQLLQALAEFHSPTGASGRWRWPREARPGKRKTEGQGHDAR